MFKLKTITFAVCAALGVAGCSALQSFRQPAAPQTSVSPSQAAYLVGRKHQAAQRYDEATAAFRQALAAEPNHVDAHNALGAVHATQGRYVEAIAEFEAAKALAPRLAYVQGNLGYAYLLRGDNDQAVRALEEAKRLDPNDDAVLRNLWMAYNRVLDQARNDMKRLAQETAQARRAETLASAGAAVPDGRKALGGAGPDAATLMRVEPQVFELKMPPAPQARVLAAPAAERPKAAPPMTAPSPTAEAKAVLPAAFAAPALPQSAKAFRLEVSNGNGVTGMARAVSQQLVARGFSRGYLTNQLPFRELVTLVQYRQGYEHEASRVSQALEVVAGVAPSDKLRSGVHVRVLLGHDAVPLAAARKATGGRFLAQSTVPAGK